MRVAIAGKGGVGKTALAGMLATALARRGRHVLACDFDVNPGLGLALAPLDRSGRLPPEAVEHREGSQYGWALRSGLSPTEAVGRYAATGRGGVRLLGFGDIDTAGHDLATTHMATREVAAGMDDPGWDVVVDMEAGTKDVFDGSYVAFVDLLVAVTDGSAVADLACRRLASIAASQGGPRTGLLLNRATPSRLPAARALAEELRVAFLGAVPDDEAVRRADVEGAAVEELAPDALAAVEELAMRLQEMTQEVRR